MQTQLLSILFALSMSADVSYFDLRGGNLTGVIEIPSTALSHDGKFPAAIIFHDANGINDHEKMKAIELKSRGWIAFVADIFATRNLEQIQQTKPHRTITVETRRERAQAAFNFISAHPQVNAQYIVAMGYCFGGTMTLELGRIGADVKLLSTFHAGNLAAPNNQEYGNITGTVLINNGANDKVTMDAIVDLQTQLTNYEVDWEFVNYGNTLHAFTVKADERYQPDSDRRSWRKTWELMYDMQCDICTCTVQELDETNTTDIEYTDADGALLQGFLAQPKKISSKRPAALIIHGWGGLVQFHKDFARKLAGHGYTAFAADIFGKGVRPTDISNKAGNSSLYLKNGTLALQRIDAAINFLKQDVLGVEPSQIVIFGYCFGGTMALTAARGNLPLAAVISFHGGNLLPADVPKITSKFKGVIVVNNGASDAQVSVEEIESFQQEMNNASVDWYFSNYGHALHGFTEESAPPSGNFGYNQEAASRSFNDAMSILNGFKQQSSDGLKSISCTDPSPGPELESSSSVKNIFESKSSMNTDPDSNAYVKIVFPVLPLLILLFNGLVNN